MRADEAQRHFRAAMALDPESAVAAARLAAALGAGGALAEARAVIERALPRAPDHAPLHFQLGNLLTAQGDEPAALAAYHRAVELQPRWTQALIVLGKLHNIRREFDQALAALAQARGAGDDSAECWAQIGFALIGCERFSGASAALVAALARNPRDTAAWRALGHSFRLRGRFAPARDAYRRAHEQGDPAALRGLIESVLDLGDLAAAEPLIAAIRTRADDATARWLAARRAFLAGDLARAWPDYESRLENLTDRATHPAPEWRGEDLTGKHLMVLGEQGHGDVLQFARYARLLRAQAARVSLGLEEEMRALAPLLGAAPGIDAVEIAPDLSPADYHVALLSLPHRFKTTTATIPPAAYLKPPADRAPPPALTVPGGFKVGLIWAGDPKHGNDRHRSLPFEALLPLATVPNVRLFALQYGPRAADAAGYEAVVAPLGALIADWRDTAAMIAALDLLIAVDTGPIHLAGALGRPAWVALPFAPDWRWMLGRDDSPWYPRLRLFRQSAPGDWGGVIERMRLALIPLARLTAGTRPGEAKSG